MIKVFDLWAPWYGSHKAQLPVIDALEGKFEEKVEFVKVNVNWKEAFSKEKNVSAIPTIIIEKDGNEMKRFVDFTDESTLSKEIETLI